MRPRSSWLPALAGSLLLVSCSRVDRPPAEIRPAPPPVVVESAHVTYTLTLPEGWESSPDEESLFGVRTLIFEKGSSFKEGVSVMYASEPCAVDCTGKLGPVLEHVLEAARKNSPALQVSDAEPLETRYGRAEVRILTGSADPRQAREALAFIERPEVVLLLVLSTSNPGRWERDYRAFADIVRGVEFRPAAARA